MTIENIIQEYQIGNYCHLMEQLGFNSYVFPRKEAIDVMGILKENFCQILGIDSYVTCDGQISFSYDFICCNQEENENPYEFLNRSHEEAMKFLNDRINRNDYLYEIIFKDMEV